MDWSLLYWIAQAIGVIGLGFQVLTFQMRTRERILLFQIFAEGVYIVHYLMLGAYTGAAMSGFVALRNSVFRQKDKQAWAKSPVWLLIFAMLGVGLLLYSWVGWKSLLPVAGSALATWGYWQGSPATIRFYIMLACVLWLPYTILVGSIGGALSQLVSMASVGYAMVKYDGYGGGVRRLLGLRP